MRGLIVILLLFLSSCAAEEFEVSSASLVSISSDESRHLELSASFSDPDSSYTYRLSSPDSDLVWEGAMTGDGSDKTSDEILLTSGASFPKGEYSVIFYSDNGTDLTVPVTLR